MLQLNQTSLRSPTHNPLADNNSASLISFPSFTCHTQNVLRLKTPVGLTRVARTYASNVSVPSLLGSLYVLIVTVLDGTNGGNYNADCRAVCEDNVESSTSTAVTI